MEHEPDSELQRRLQAALEQIAADRIRLDALIARIDALEVPIDRAEVQDELDRMAEHLQAVTARVAKLEVAPDQQPDPPAPRPRGVIGALRAERPAADGGPAD